MALTHPNEAEVIESMTSLAILLAAMFLHELGHASMALVLGVKVLQNSASAALE
jgi:hypothetical protein